jgi:hypothetical protein
MGRIILYIVENKQCMKPPTSYGGFPLTAKTKGFFYYLPSGNLLQFANGSHGP